MKTSYMIFAVLPLTRSSNVLMYQQIDILNRLKPNLALNCFSHVKLFEGNELFVWFSIVFHRFYLGIMSFKQPRLSNFFQSHQNGDDALDKKEFRKSWDSGSNNVHNSNPAVYNPERHSSVSNVSNSYASTHNRFDAFRSGDQNSPHGSTNVTRNSDAAISNPSAKKRRVLPNSIISNLGRETSSKVGAVGAYSNSNYPSLSVGRPPTYSAPQATPKPSPEISADEPLSLSKSQKRVLDAIMTGKSVFFTGAAGDVCILIVGQLV